MHFAGAQSRRTLHVLGPRIASALAIAPLGVWTVCHIGDNLAAFGGARSWQREVTSHDHPGAGVLSATLVFAPLLIHTIWGIGRLFTSRPNNVHYPTLRNLKYLLQRISAVGVFLFLCAHLWLAFIHPRFVVGAPESFADISHEMRFHTPTLVVYLLGTLGVAYHLANGVFGFVWSTGIAASRAALRHFETLSLVLFIVLWAMSWGAVFALYRAGVP